MIVRATCDAYTLIIMCFSSLRAYVSNCSKFTLFTVNDGRTATVPQYRGLTSAFVTIFRQEGVKGLYKGVTPNVWGSGSAWGLYFML